MPENTASNVVNHHRPCHDRAKPRWFIALPVLADDSIALNASYMAHGTVAWTSCLDILVPGSDTNDEFGGSIPDTYQEIETC